MLAHATMSRQSLIVSVRKYTVAVAAIESQGTGALIMNYPRKALREIIKIPQTIEVLYPLWYNKTIKYYSLNKNAK